MGNTIGAHSRYIIGASAASPTLVVKTENCLYIYWASVSEPHTSELNRDFSSNIIIIICLRRSVYS